MQRAAGATFGELDECSNTSLVPDVVQIRTGVCLALKFLRSVGRRSQERGKRAAPVEPIHIRRMG
jgi:hypothetical protein